MQLCNVCINSHPSHSRSTLNKQDNTQIHFHIDVLRIHISNDWMLFLFSKSITRKFNYIWDSSRLITVKYRRSETTSIDCQRFLVARSRFSNCNSFSFRIKGVNRRVVIPILYYCVHLHLIHLNRHKNKLSRTVIKKHIPAVLVLKPNPFMRTVKTIVYFITTQWMAKKRTHQPTEHFDG